MTTKEKLMMQVNSEFIRNLIKQRNAGTEDCITSSELAREIGIPVADMHDILIEKKVLCRRHRELRPTLSYQERGYEKYRSTFRYKKTGELLEIVYPVWTDKGQRMIKEKMNERNSKN
jgi:phage antirepressor YoqD-like protein